MRISSTSAATSARNVEPLTPSKNEGRGTPARLATVVERCGNSPQQTSKPEPAHGQCKGSKKISRVRQEKHFSRNMVSRQPLVANSFEAARVELRMKKSVQELKLVEKSRKDPEFSRQVIDAVYASIYSAAKDEFCRMVAGKGLKVPEGYLYAIGEEARRINIACNNKDGIATPAAAGANPFVTPVLSQIQKSFPEHMAQPGQSPRLRVRVEAEVAKLITPLAVERGLPSPEVFAAKLAEIGASWAGNSAETLI